ncbi:hypothetical protein OY671_013070, partial [Metschnikowia pulcherrima]
MGQLSASGVSIVSQQVSTEEQLRAWGWRVPFSIGAACAVAASLSRRTMHETAAFEQEREHQPSSRRSLAHPREVSTVVGSTMGGTVAFYTFTTYAQKFMVNTAGWSKEDATSVSASVSAGFMGSQPSVGASSDRIGRR